MRTRVGQLVQRGWERKMGFAETSESGRMVRALALYMRLHSCTVALMRLHRLTFSLSSYSPVTTSKGVPGAMPSWLSMRSTMRCEFLRP